MRSSDIGAMAQGNEASRPSLTARINRLDWPALTDDLDARGFALTGKILHADECRSLIRDYPADDRYRSTVVMARYNFGEGEYRYFAYPLPDAVAGIRAAVYPHLVATANQWCDRMGRDVRYPATLNAMLAACRDAGQARPTPLILRYATGGYNCLHQDLYGEVHFPIQLAVLLDQPGEDFDGGEFVLTEQRPRMQSRARVVPLARGEGVLFAVNERPVRGKRGDYRVKMRHGVSEISRGNRHTLGVIFHDAQ